MRDDNCEYDSVKCDYCGHIEDEVLIDLDEEKPIHKCPKCGMETYIKIICRPW